MNLDFETICKTDQNFNSIRKKGRKIFLAATMVCKLPRVWEDVSGAKAFYTIYKNTS